MGDHGWGETNKPNLRANVSNKGRSKREADQGAGRKKQGIDQKPHAQISPEGKKRILGKPILKTSWGRQCTAESFKKPKSGKRGGGKKVKPVNNLGKIRPIGWGSKKLGAPLVGGRSGRMKPLLGGLEGGYGGLGLFVGLGGQESMKAGKKPDGPVCESGEEYPGGGRTSKKSESGNYVGSLGGEVQSPQNPKKRGPPDGSPAKWVKGGAIKNLKDPIFCFGVEKGWNSTLKKSSGANLFIGTKEGGNNKERGLGQCYARKNTSGKEVRVSGSTPGGGEESIRVRVRKKSLADEGTPRIGPRSGHGDFQVRKQTQRKREIVSGRSKSGARGGGVNIHLGRWGVSRNGRLRH